MIQNNGLSHDHVICSKFTTKPRLRKLFSNHCHLQAVFTRVFFSSLLLCTSKARLGGETTQSDVNMHKGYQALLLKCYISCASQIKQFTWGVFCHHQEFKRIGLKDKLNELHYASLLRIIFLRHLCFPFLNEIGGFSDLT